MIFSFGYGYVAQYFGGVGTSRSSQGKGKFIYNGGPLTNEILSGVEQVDYVLITIPPQNEQDILIESVKQNLSSFQHLKWIGYLSSTSVYGDHKGQWVDENSPTNPTSLYGSARLKAEKEWLSLDLPLHIFRLAGIYGPGRNALEDLKAGKARRIFKKDSVFSRVHVSDIHQVIDASMRQPNPGQTYNVADNLPSPSHEVVAYAAKLLGIEPPPLMPYEDANFSPLGQSFYQDSKRVCNKRILKDLIPVLKYPTYKEGLKGLLRSAL